MRTQIPKVYPITDAHISGLSHAEQVLRLAEGGASMIQLRDKFATPREFLRKAAEASDEAVKHGVRLIINDRVDIAMALNAAGVHLGQSDLPIEAARRLLRNAIIGVSSHNLDEIRTATRLPVDYIAFGPVFDTGTKTDHEPVVGLDRLREAKAVLGDIPLVAIGGITASNIHDALSAGADSVAVISAVLENATKIAENMRQLLALAAS